MKRNVGLNSDTRFKRFAADFLMIPTLTAPAETVINGGGSRTTEDQQKTHHPADGNS